MARSILPRLAAALAALEGLQAATVTALKPADYMARVAEVSIEITPALSETPDRSDVRDAIDAAIRYHAFAARAESVYEGRGDLAAIGRDPVVATCRPLTELVARAAAQLGLDPSHPVVVGLVASTEGAPALRTCAAEQIAEAERRARAPR